MIESNRQFIKLSVTAFLMFIIAIAVLILFLISRSWYKNEISDIKNQNRILKEDVFVTKRDTELKINTMYNLIITTYGNKYSPKYNTGKKREYQGLEPRWQQPYFVRKARKYEEKLDIPYFTLITTAKIETAFNPLAETRWPPTKKQKKEKKKGDQKET